MRGSVSSAGLDEPAHVSQMRQVGRLAIELAHRASAARDELGDRGCRVDHGRGPDHQAHVALAGELLGLLDHAYGKRLAEQ